MKNCSNCREYERHQCEDLSQLTGTQLFNNKRLHLRIEDCQVRQDRMLIISKSGSITTMPRLDFLPDETYLIHFNIASAKNPPHLEPLPNAKATTSTSRLCMVEGQDQYVIEMEAAVMVVNDGRRMQPTHLGIVADFGDRTPRIRKTGRTYKTWTTGIEYGGSTGASTTWAQVDSWEEMDHVEMKYWVSGNDNKTLLYTPNARANSLKLWGVRLGDWLSNYPEDKLEALGIKPSVPFLVSTGQILFEDDGKRSINPFYNPNFFAVGKMKIDEGREIICRMEAATMPRCDKTFTPTSPSFSYYDKKEGDK